jgi:hypothetical protein
MQACSKLCSKHTTPSRIGAEFHAQNRSVAFLYYTYAWQRASRATIKSPAHIDVTRQRRSFGSAAASDCTVISRSTRIHSKGFVAHRRLGLYSVCRVVFVVQCDAAADASDIELAPACLAD